MSEMEIGIVKRTRKTHVKREGSIGSVSAVKNTSMFGLSAETLEQNYERNGERTPEGDKVSPFTYKPTTSPFPSGSPVRVPGMFNMNSSDRMNSDAPRGSGKIRRSSSQESLQIALGNLVKKDFEMNSPSPIPVSGSRIPAPDVTAAKPLDSPVRKAIKNFETSSPQAQSVMSPVMANVTSPVKASVISPVKTKIETVITMQSQAVKTVAQSMQAPMATTSNSTITQSPDSPFVGSRGISPSLEKPLSMKDVPLSGSITAENPSSPVTEDVKKDVASTDAATTQKVDHAKCGGCVIC